MKEEKKLDVFFLFLEQISFKMIVSKKNHKDCVKCE